MKFIDLFAGIGGFRYGLESVDRKADRRSEKIKENGSSKRHSQLKETKTKRGQHGKHSNSRGHKELFACVYSNEWDKYANQIYKKHFGECDSRDITTVNAKEIPDHDLLCAGFPCQSFSVAGKRLGFDDTRGTLFFEIARIAKHKRPRYLLLENVKGLLSHDQGKTFQTIIGVLTDLGYRVEWQVLNSKHFGVPQNRERVFIIGYLGEGSRQKVFPIKGNNTKNGLEGEAVFWDDRNKKVRKISPTLDGPEHNSIRLVEASRQDILKKGNKSNDTSITRRSSYSIRRLTPTECERLQGFPDGWTEGISDTQRYKCLGNAVTTNVVEAIASSLWKK